MKKFLFLAIAALTIGLVNAQSTKITTKTITAADTVTFTNVPSKMKSFQYTFTETSGTTAGKVYFEGTISGAYVTLDSLTLADVATAQSKVFTVSATSYLSYRFRNTNTSSATGTVKAAWLRRTDE